jgi:hypothetical protein
MPNLGLSVSDIVPVNILLTPKAAQLRNFGSLLVLGDSGVIDTTERLRAYTSIDGIAADCGTNSPEYLAGLLYFSQSPQPQVCYVGAWARTATKGTLRGAVLSSAQQLMTNFTSINNGGMSVTINGTLRALTGLDFTAQTNLNGVASVIQTALSTNGSITWDANNGRFVLQSNTTGTSSTVTFASAPASGTDVSNLLGLRSTSGGYVIVGIAAESLVTAVQTLAGMSNEWYGLQVASSVAPSANDYTAVAGFIEAAGASHIFGITTQDAATLDSVSTTDIASVIKGLNYKRTFVQYSSSNAYASASIFGRAFTVDFNGQNTTITIKFKQEPGITAESLTETQAATLKSKNCNVFVRYNNSTAILQEGVMSNGFFFDEVHNTDWLQNDLYRRRSSICSTRANRRFRRRTPASIGS